MAFMRSPVRSRSGPPFFSTDMKTLAALLVVVTTIASTATLLAHEITFKGTVVSVDATSVKITVIDEKTKKPVVKTFDYDKDTKVMRGDKRVSIADAKIQKDEKISVTIDHDADETLAIVIRLDAGK